jgi:Domain of unknown function (DUF4410)
MNKGFTMLKSAALIGLLLNAGFAQESVKPEPALAKPTPAASKAPVAFLDKGLLDPSWFGPDSTTFSKTDDIDFFWIKPGLDLSGQTLWMKPWDDPVMLQKGRDGKDNAVATRLTDTLPGMLRGALAGAFAGKAKVNRNEGNVLVSGRIVDCNAGSRAAKWLVGLGAGQENATFDIKFVDAKSHELLIAIHHRTISGTNLSTIDDKLVKWSEKFGLFVASKTTK